MVDVPGAGAGAAVVDVPGASGTAGAGAAADDATGAGGTAGAPVLGICDGGELSGGPEAGARTGTAFAGISPVNPTSTIPFATTTAATKAARMKRAIESPHRNRIYRLRGRLGSSTGRNRAALPFDIRAQ